MMVVGLAGLPGTEMIFPPLIVFALLFLLAYLFARSTVSPSNAKLPPSVPIPPERLERLRAAIEDESYSPRSRKLSETIVTVGDMHRYIRVLYPEYATELECWDEYEDYWVFSLSTGGRLRNTYKVVLFGRKNGAELRHADLVSEL